jgi:hypothetical protein
MVPQELSPLECCQYCPHRESVTGSCEHDIRQAIVQQLTEGQSGVCPEYREVRSQAMDDLSEQLDL